ncbi:MAG: CARDB domain-containing protein [Caldilineaceae bacterium]
MAFADYVNGTGNKDVEIKIYLSKPGQVLLTDLVIERNQTVDLTPTFTLAGTPTEGPPFRSMRPLLTAGAVDSGPLTVSYYATLRQGRGDVRNTPTYIGSAFVPNIPAGRAYRRLSTGIPTHGATGPVTVTAAVDPFNRLSELDESNNHATGQLTIRTRPDLMIAHVTLSNEEPPAGEPVDLIVDWQNGGETPTGNHKAALYQGNPADQGQLVQLTEVAGIDAKTTRSTTFTWTPPTPGHYRLFLQADGENQVNEFDESNNAHWLDLYVGMASPLTIDSGGDGDSSYSTGQGYGVVDEGSPDQTGNCGDAAHQTYRQDPSGQVIYRFDHLLPGHFYHLDVTLYECGQNAGRQQRVLIDGIAMAGPIDLGDGEIHRLSLLLDPALYADRTISVTVAVEGTGGALVNEIAVVDVDYRYADAGGATDVAYPTGRRAYGWLDGVAQKPWGTLPYQTLREDQQDNEVRYRFDGLDPQKAYQVHFSFYQRSGNHRVQQVWIDDRPVSSDLTIVAGTRSDHTVSVPITTFADGTIQVAVRRTDGATTGAMISEIALEELTQEVTVSCQTATTPFFTSAYGQLTIDKQPAPVGTVVTAENLSGEIVGCFTVDTAGSYGFMTIYGADASAVPAIPGMKEGEQVIFRVNGIMAKSTPALVWHDDKATHEITLAITNAPDQLILLQSGWNLFSFRVEPPVSLIDILLQPISGKYCKVLGERGIYDCNVPANFRSLKELQAGAGYYARIEGQTSVNLLINGVEQPADTPIALHPGLNWVGYLPTVTLPITTALQSIGEQLVQVADGQGHIYDPTKPTFSTLKKMTSGSGYLIYTSAAVTLTYPTALPATTALHDQSESDLSGNSSCPAVLVTPYYTVLYGQLTQDGTALPVGANVEAITPRGEVAGCGQVQVAGQYGFLTLFGTEQGATSGGFLAGETVTLRIHEELITLPEPFVWRDDKSTHEVDVEIRGSQKVYLPLTIEQGQ